jgi:hypothetical protein
MNHLRICRPHSFQSKLEVWRNTVKILGSKISTIFDGETNHFRNSAIKRKNKVAEYFKCISKTGNENKSTWIHFLRQIFGRKGRFKRWH